MATKELKLEVELNTVDKSGMGLVESRIRSWRLIDSIHVGATLAQSAVSGTALWTRTLTEGYQARELAEILKWPGLFKVVWMVWYGTVTRGWYGI